MDRRKFIKTTIVAGVGMYPWRSVDPPLHVASSQLRPEPTEIGAAAGLPPRTIGLRSLGGDFRFDPPGLRIEAGGSVIWLNMGDFHTTTAFHPDNAARLNGDVPLRIPEGAEPWHSGMLGLTAGTEFEHAFTIEGVYDYFCQPHYSFGMVGRIIVGRPHEGPAVTRPLSELNEPSRKVMPAVEEIMGPAGRTYEWAARINGTLLLRVHGEPLAPAVEAIGDGVRRDGELLRTLEHAEVGSRFDERLSMFLDELRAGSDYERLVARADAAKQVLQQAHAARPA